MKITVDGVPPNGSGFWTLMSKYGKQIPYAISLALNELAKEVRLDTMGYLKSKFTIRRDSLLTNPRVGVRMKFANKRDLEAVVYSKFEPWRLHEDGGTQKAAKKARAIPLRENLNVSDETLIPKGKRPLAMKGKRGVFTMQTKEGFSGIWKRNGKSLKLLYALKAAVKIKQAINTQANASVIVAKKYAHYFGQALGKAISTSRDK